MQNQNSVSDRERYVQEQIEVWSKKYHIPFECEYELKKYFELQHQYDTTPDEHVKTKRELLDMMSKLKAQLPRLKTKSNNVIYDKLLKASVKRELVRVTRNERGIGKTTTLLKFAKEFDLGVIVPFNEIARSLRNEYDYEKIYGVNELRGKDVKKIVVDEGIDQIRLQELKDNQKFEIITGFTVILTL